MGGSLGTARTRAGWRGHSLAVSQCPQAPSSLPTPAQFRQEPGRHRARWMALGLIRPEAPLRLPEAHYRLHLLVRPPQHFLKSVDQQMHAEQLPKSGPPTRATAIPGSSRGRFAASPTGTWTAACAGSNGSICPDRPRHGPALRLPGLLRAYALRIDPIELMQQSSSVRIRGRLEPFTLYPRRSLDAAAANQPIGRCGRYSNAQQVNSSDRSVVCSVQRWGGNPACVATPIRKLWLRERGCQARGDAWIPPPSVFLF